MVLPIASFFCFGKMFNNINSVLEIDHIKTLSGTYEYIIYDACNKYIYMCVCLNIVEIDIYQ